MPSENPLPCIRREVEWPCACCRSAQAALKPLLEECRRVIKGLKEDVPTGFIECNGDKCRQGNCLSCHGEFAEEYDTKAADAVVAQIDALLKEKEGTGPDSK